MTNRELGSRIIAAHESVEHLLAGVNEAVQDTRFKLSLSDHRHFQGLLQDIQIMANEAERNSIAIPAQLPVVGQMQKVELARSIKAKTRALQN